MRGISRIKKAYRTARRRFKPSALILMYHRVANLTHDPFQLAISPTHFEQQLNYIKETCVPIPLMDLYSDLVEGKITPRSVAVTFDDGYIDNLKNAYPLLKSAGIPATLFIASDSIGSQRELWWDELERVFFEVQIPRSLSLEIQGQQYTWEITTPADRTPTLMAVHQKLKYLPYAKRQEIQKYLLAWADIPAKGRPDYLLLDASGIVEISQDGLVEIGAHTVTHQALSSLSRNEQRDEIVLCRQPLEAIYGKPVRTFAYPYGKEADFTVDTMNIVRKSGYALACSTIPGCIESGDNPYQLNRFGIHNWDDKTFKQLIEDMFVA